MEVRIENWYEFLPVRGSAHDIQPLRGYLYPRGDVDCWRGHGDLYGDTIMAWETLGSGNVLEAGSITPVINTAQPNSYVRLVFDLSSSPAGWMIDSLRDALDTAGLTNVDVFSGSPSIVFQWFHEGTIEGRIGYAPLVIVAVILVALAVIGIVIIGWRVLNQTSASITVPLLALAGVAGATALLVYLIKRK